MDNTPIENPLPVIDAFLSAGKFVQAERMLQPLLLQAPNAPELLERALQLRAAQSRWTESIELAENVLSVDPVNENARYYLAICYDRLEKPNQALNIWRGLIAQKPDSPEYHAELANVILWNPQLGISSDEIELHLRAALALEPLNRTAKFVEFWLAQKAGDGARMEKVVGEIQRAYPAENFSAQLLSRFIRDYRRADSQAIPGLLRLFPTDSVLLEYAKEVAATNTMLKMAETTFFEIFAEEPPGWLKQITEADFVSPRAVLLAAADGAPEFGKRKFAKYLLEVPEADVFALASILSEISIADAGRRQRVRPYLESLIRLLPPEDRERMMLKLFSMNFDELFRFLLNDVDAQPKAETWDAIWPKILDRPKLLDAVLEKYGVFKNPPPVSLDLLIDPKTKALRKSMLYVCRHLRQRDPSVVATLWLIFIDRGMSLPTESQEELLGLVAGGELTHLLGTTNLMPALISTLREPKNFLVRSYSALWDGLSYLPDAYIKRFALRPGYDELIEEIFRVMMQTTTGPFASRLAVFLTRAPLSESQFSPHRDETSRLMEESLDSTLSSQLRELIRRFPPPPVKLVDAPPIEPAVPKGPTAAELTEQNARLSAQLKTAKMQAEILSLQAQLQFKMQAIQASPSSPEEKLKAIQAASEEFKKAIEQATADLKAT